MGLQDLFNWREKTVQTTANTPAVGDEDLAADVDEPPELQKEITKADFHKAAIHFEAPRKESLLTQALKSPDMVNSKHDAPIHVNTDLMRRRSMMSNASLASTAELTSDGGLTSPARTNTPSPPPPSNAYTSFGSYSLGAVHSPVGPMVPVEIKDSTSHLPDVLSISPRAQPPAEVVPKKRCITFACGGSTRAAKVVQPTPIAPPAPAAVAPAAEAPKRRCTIKFACPAPKDMEKEKVGQSDTPKRAEAPKQVESGKRTSRSPSMTRKSPRPTSSGRSQHRESTGTIRRASQSPAAVRTKPKYMTADEKTLQSSEATRFHEFASEVIQEDEWILKESVPHKVKMTINDTLKKENAIRLLGNEAEEEALEEEDEEDEDDGNESDNESEEDDEEDEERSDFGGSDGNESDNEAGFADSDDGSEDGGDLAFWTPGRSITIGRNIEASTYRASAHRTASASSIDSLSAMYPIREQARSRRKPKPIKIRPGTPDLPDSTDFVCGTLDEDRPLEEAYVSCMKARENARHKQIPQDIDPSFPTSDIEDEEDENDDFPAAIDSEDQAWHQGKFEVDDDERPSRRRVMSSRKKSPAMSPKPIGRLHSPPPPRRMHSPPPPARRLHSPPPAKTRLRSPPPRKLFGGHSPKRTRSPPPRAINSPPGSPTYHPTSAAIAFAPLGSRPGLTHTKSLPRTPNAFCRAYNASRIIAANGNNDDDSNDGHVRGAIDIVKGLEQKRQRRKEKFYQKHCNRKAKGQITERRPQPGKGAERMRELGLLMAGKKGGDDPYMMSA